MTAVWCSFSHLFHHTACAGYQRPIN